MSYRIFTCLFFGVVAGAALPVNVAFAQQPGEPPLAPSVQVPAQQPSVQPKAPPRPKPATPSPPQQRPASAANTTDIFVSLVRTTLAALNHANVTGNYAVLHALAAPEFQAESEPVKLAATFKSFRDQGIDLTPATVIAPQFIQQPGFDAKGNLRLVGAFPTQPLQVRFDLAFKQIDGRWRHTGLAVAALPSSSKSASPVQQGQPAQKQGAAPVTPPAQAKAPPPKQKQPPGPATTPAQNAVPAPR